jgi:hypothetical protein
MSPLSQLQIKEVILSVTEASKSQTQWAATYPKVMLDTALSPNVSRVLSEAVVCWRKEISRNGGTAK